MKKLSSTVAILGLSAAACSSLYPLGNVGKKAADPYNQDQVITVNTASRELEKVKHIAWGAFSVSFECENECRYSETEREAIAQEVAEKSFSAFDRAIRNSLGQGRELIDVAATAKNPEYVSFEIQNGSFQDRVGRWLARIGLKRNTSLTATARGLKFSDPEAIGWSGGKSLSALAERMKVQGVLVGHIRLSPQRDPKAAGQFVVQGPKVWLFTSKTDIPVAFAGVRPAWTLEVAAAGTKPVARFNWKGIEEVAQGFSARMARALQEN